MCVCAAMAEMFPQNICIVLLASEECRNVNDCLLPLLYVFFVNFINVEQNQIAVDLQDPDLCSIKDLWITYEFSVCLVFCLFFKMVLSPLRRFTV